MDAALLSRRTIVAKLREKKLKPAPMADKHSLVRRAYFDLLGLPPTPEQVDRFLNDASPNAFSKLVDELLNLLGGGPSLLMAHIIETGKLTRHDIAEAEDVLAKH